MDIEQSNRSKIGHAFEKNILDDIKNGLGDQNKIKVLHPHTQVYLPGTKRPERFSCLQIRTPYGTIIGDTDIVILNDLHKIPLILISCKVSIRGRLAQSLFHWSLYKQKYPSILLFFVTADKGSKGRSELGTLKKPSKSRIFIESQNVHCYTTNTKTEIGGAVHPISEMIIDIKRYSGVKQ